MIHHLGRNWYEDVSIGGAVHFFSTSRWRRCMLLLLVEMYYEGGAVRTYLVQLRLKPSVCHGSRFQRGTIWAFSIFACQAHWLLGSW